LLIKNNKTLGLNTLIIPLLIGGGMAVALLREILIAHFYGTSVEVEIFRVAYALPNFISFSVATAFTSAAVPIIIRSQAKEQDQDTIFSLNILVIVFVIFITSLGILSGSQQAKIFAPGFSGSDLQQLTYHIKASWLMFFFIGLTFTMRSSLQANGVIWPGASNNIIKAGVYVLVFALGLLFTNNNFNLTWLTSLAVASGLIILLVHFIACYIHNINVWKIKKIIPKPILFGMVIALSSTFIFQILNIIPVFLDRRYASQIAQGVIASLDYSYAIIIAIGSLLGASFNMVVLPKMVTLFETKASWLQFKKIVMAAIAIISITIISGIVIGYFSEPVVRTLFMRGAFSEQSVYLTSDILSWQALGMGFMVASTMATQILVIFKMFRQLIIVGLSKIAFKILSLMLLIPMYNVKGFGVSFFLVEGITFLLLAILVFRKIKG